MFKVGDTVEAIVDDTFCKKGDLFEIIEDNNITGIDKAAIKLNLNGVIDMIHPNLSTWSKTFKLYSRPTKYKFNVGDKIVCVDVGIYNERHLTKGEVYTVLRYNKSVTNTSEPIVETDDGYKMSFMESRFELLVDKPKVDKVEENAFEIALKSIVKVTEQTHDRAFTALSVIQKIALDALRNS
jgi:hypothetical protein